MKEHKIDLHMHSLHSDGTQSFQELFNELTGKGADIISITDHDCVDGYFELQKNPNIVPKGLTVVYGVEVTCNFDDSQRDMLAYGVDINVMKQYFDKKNDVEYRKNKERKILNILKKKCKDYGLVFDEKIDIKTGAKSEGFNTMYYELIKHKENLTLCPGLEDINVFYWQNVANKKTTLFVNQAYDMPSFEEAVNLIHQAGGLAFLAHPYCYKMSDEQTEFLIESAVKAGIDGIEVEHSFHNQEEREKIEVFAKKYNLYTSGGSDYHGTHKPRISSLTGTNGNVNVKFERIEPWFSLVKKIISK